MTQNLWSSLLMQWGQAAIDERPIVLDSHGERASLFVAVRESLQAKEHEAPVDVRSFCEEGLDKRPLVIVPFSGGLDSLVLLERSRVEGTEVRPMYVALNTPYKDRELHAIVELEELDTIVVDMTYWPKNWEPYKTAWSHILPLRNLLIITAMAEMNGDRPGTICLGATDGEIPLKGGDKSVRFFDAVDSILATFPVKHKLAFPLRQETKTDLVAWWLASGRDPGRLLKSVTCQSGTPVACGECHACFNRWVALRNNGLEEPTLADPRRIVANHEKVASFEFALKARNFSVWSEKRILQTLAAWSKRT